MAVLQWSISIYVGTHQSGLIWRSLPHSTTKCPYIISIVKHACGSGIQSNNTEFIPHFCRALQAPPPLILEAGPLDTSDREAVMRFAGECVREGERERKKVESRAELLRQLQEAEATEAKENLKVVYYMVVVSRRGLL